MHSPCYQFMRANGEAIICSRTSRVEESLKKEFSFPSDMRVSLLPLSCIFKNVTVPSHFVKIALIYKESLYLQIAPHFWLYGFKNQTTTTKNSRLLAKQSFVMVLNQEKKILLSFPYMINSYKSRGCKSFAIPFAMSSCMYYTIHSALV